ncbi:MAG: hypothetical protein M3008_12355 [Chloroflexota bacterium]|nr:hypothetical protein [Chloroflexota bacterium]
MAAPLAILARSARSGGGDDGDVYTDRGLWSPRIWRAIRALGWHPVMRVRTDCTVAPTGGSRQLPRLLSPDQGMHGSVRGAFKPQKRTLVIVWESGQAAIVGAKGWGWLVRQVVCGRVWKRLWLLPESWPTPPIDVTICYHPAPA